MREASATSDDFDAFFDKHYPAMVRSLTMITGDAEIAADAVQDAFIRGYARWDRIRRYDKPEAWIRRVAINRSRDMFRSLRRRRRREESVAPVEAMASGENPVDDSLVIADAVAELPRQQRIAVTLYYLESLSVAEVAESMGISTGAVKFHLNKGRDRLAPLLDRSRR